jgi:DNA-binding response OmpR family regulator
MDMKPAPANPGSTAAPSRVLLIENDDDTRNVLSKVLVRDGFEVLAAGDCATAWDATKNLDHLHLAIGDIGLSDGDGRRLLGELKVKFGCPTLALSGYTREQARKMLAHPPADTCGRVEVAEAGPDVWLVKPVSIADFRSAVVKLIRHG